MDYLGSTHSSEASWVVGDFSYVPVNAKEQHLSYNWEIFSHEYMANKGHYCTELRPDLNNLNDHHYPILLSFL